MTTLAQRAASEPLECADHLSRANEERAAGRVLLPDGARCTVTLPNKETVRGVVMRSSTGGIAPWYDIESEGKIMRRVCAQRVRSRR